VLNLCILNLNQVIGMSDPSNPYRSPVPPEYEPPTGQPPSFGYQAAPGPYPATMPQVGLAHWGQRVLVSLLDGLYLLVFSIPAIIGFGMAVAGYPDTDSRGNDIPGTGDSTTTNTGLVIGGLGLLVVLGAYIWNRYVRDGRGQSFGRRRLGLWLLSDSTGQPIGGGMAFVRDIAHFLDSWFYLGYLWPLWDRKRQTFADKVCGTIVSTSPPAPVGGGYLPYQGVANPVAQAPAYGAPEPQLPYGLAPPPSPYGQSPYGQSPYGPTPYGQSPDGQSPPPPPM
jgi:uncharacterized RDD family membrane protein YckC